MNYIMKYLVVKMCLGYGYSVTKEEIDGFRKYFGFSTDNCYDTKYIIEKNNTYYSLYTLDKNIMPLENIENIGLISEYIINNVSKPILNIKVDNEMLDRAKYLSIYIINALNGIESNIALEDMEEEFTRDYRDIFTNISTIIAKLLTKSKNENLDDNSLLQIINVDPTRIISSYKAYCNYRILDDNLNNELSTKFDGYGFAMIFGFYKYYSLPSYESDSCFVVDQKSMYGPIYIPAVKDADPLILRTKEEAESEAKKLIKKMSTYSSNL